VKTENAPCAPPIAAFGSDSAKSNFIRDIIDADLQSGRHNTVVTRFPPEPNGYLHIGHAKSICLNFGIARDYKKAGHTAFCHLRFDDTNPTKEDIEYVESIQHDVKWLGFDWGDKMFFASDYFEKLYDIAVYLIKKGKAYVDSSTLEEIREGRGSLTEPGKDSPYRSRSVEESLDLFARMRKGEFSDGAHVLRAKIDMSAKNMLMRDPVIYRIRHAHHHRTGDAWCIYPMYDYAHPLSDAIESITHSICTLEFENNREFYDWLVAEARDLLPSLPHQYEFARLSLAYTMMSKRNLLKLVEEKVVSGWDDPRMPTIAGLRRRGYTPEAIRDFADMIGVAKANSQVDYEKLEYCIRNDLNYRAPRRMCVLDPLKVVISNFPEGQREEVAAADFPPDVNKPGTRPLSFSREMYIERSDFEEHPPKGFHRLSPGQEVRLLFSYIIRCEDVIKDASGHIIELRCSYDPQSRSGQSSRRVKGNIHWVDKASAKPCEVRLYERLFVAQQPGVERDFHEDLNPESLRVINTALIEPSVESDEAGSRYQFARQGFFASDVKDSRPGHLVFNRIVTLRDSWAKSVNDGEAEEKPTEKAAAKPEPAEKADERSRPQKKSRAQIRAEARQKDPQLAARFARYRDDLKLGEEEADILSGEALVAEFFDSACAIYANPQSIAKWIMSELLRAQKDRPLSELPLGPVQLAELAKLVDEGEISTSAGKTVFAALMSEGGSPKALVDKLGLHKVADQGALEPIVDKVLADNADNVARYKEGKKTLLGMFVGQVLKATGGSADPTLARKLIIARIGE
jgi:glutaminyl-tRNA synthetase